MSYPDPRTQEILRLRHEERWSLQAIADQYGVSKQRIFQIVGNTGYIKKRLYEDTLEDPAWLERHKHLTDQEVADLLGCPFRAVKKYRCGTIRTAPSVGKQAEYELALKLRGMGYTVDDPESNDYDLLINGHLKVDVKSANPGSPTSARMVTPQYHFQFGNRIKRNKCDLFIMVLRDLKVYFLVPSYQVAGSRFSFVYPNTYGRNTSCFAPYEERWDILEEMAN